ncbi:MAG: hypothetical protein ABUS51_02355, partial [Acidobacteriota bacterium]
MGTSKRHKTAWLIVTPFVAAFYFWLFGTAFDRFVWSDHLDGYYDLLARGFVSGHLYLPAEPRPELLALPDPWDATANKPYRLLDAVLYHNRYYLYHGAAPALFLFVPWRLLTRHDLPEGMAVFLFCLGGYLFLSALLLNLFPARAGPVPFGLFLLSCLALGFASCVPFLLQRTMVYEVAIASGYFCLSAGFFFLFRTLSDAGKSVVPAALCGLFFGLAVGCRPHLGLAIVPAFVVILLRPGKPRSLFAVPTRKDLLTFLLPIAACALAIGSYNYARFDNPLEIGLRYQLGDPVYQNIHLSAENILPGLYYMLACAPDLDPVFPFFRLAKRPPLNSVHWSLPNRYFLEPTTGALYLYPLALLALATPLFIGIFRDRRPSPAVLAAIYIYSVGCILFIAATGLSSQRFEVDFLPYLVLVSCALIPEQLPRLQSRGRVFWSAALAALMIYSVTINVLLAIQGPYDQWLHNKSADYIRTAKWFSPVERFRPVLNPWVHVKAYFEFPEHCPPGPFHPLIGAGKFGSRYMLSGACAGPGRLSLYSNEDTSVRTAEAVLDPGRFHLVEIEFTPEDR